MKKLLNLSKLKLSSLREALYAKPYYERIYSDPKSRQFKLALLQIKTVSDKQTNLDRANEMVREAAKNGADVIVLPEMFNCPYDRENMLKAKEFATENKHGPTYSLLKSLAKELSIFILAGMPESIEKSSKIYNTCLCFDPSGTLALKHRKLHLMDVNL
jgi:omega-amidase